MLGLQILGLGFFILFFNCMFWIFYFWFWGFDFLLCIVFFHGMGRGERGGVGTWMLGEECKAFHKVHWKSGFHIWPYHTHHTQMTIPNTWTCAAPILEPAFGFHAKGMAWPLQVGAEEHNTLLCCRHPSLQYLSDAS